MTIQVAGIGLDPPVFLAPLAGITDLPFRNLVLSFGAGLVVSEMVASQEMVQAAALARNRAELGLGLENTAVQIAGKDPYWMSECARLVEGKGAKIIDINMGCPAKKVIGGLSGSALMKDPDHAVRLIEAVVGAVKIPVTLKTRLGWDADSLNAVELARRAQDAGIQMVTIHGRTRCQFYKGAADWRAIGSVVRALDIPVIANGDIVDTETADLALKQSGADGVMVGRGAQGKPWVLAEVAADLFSEPQVNIPQNAEFGQMIAGHYQDMLSFYGVELGRKNARKHLGWYMDSLQVPKAIRRELLTEKAPEKVLSKITRIFSDFPVKTAA